MTAFLLSAILHTTPLETPRPEHPLPDMQRKEWISLNGAWEFSETDDSNDLQWLEDTPYRETITVPFCRESKLGGIERKGFVKNVWYRKRFVRPYWVTDENNARTILHFGASDYLTTVWVNGKQVTQHTGGSASFDCDISSFLQKGENTVVVRAYDDTRSGLQALGKQCPEPNSYGCLYTRTTGIWQSVWLEGVGRTYVSGFQIQRADPQSGALEMTAELAGATGGESVVVEVFERDHFVAADKFEADMNQVSVKLKVPNVKPWAPGKPYLYPMRFTVIGKDGKAVDWLDSYVGFREIRVEGPAILINGKRVFQRLILDQGFYPDGIWTAPSDAALKGDIELSMAAGFNGARLHEKVFEPRFLYWADKLGYLVWGEFPNWGLNYKDKRIEKPMRDEWAEIVKRDRNHPSVVGWCPFNETPGDAIWLQNPVVELTRKLDPTRPVIDSSGYAHGLSKPQILDAHDYDQNPITFRRRWDAAMGLGVGIPARYSGSPSTKGIPFMVSEYGGIGWDTTGGWGYGEGPKTLEEFYTRFRGLSDALLDNRNMFGFCYTQLTDVEQEKNGIYKYDRTTKFDVKRLRAIVSRPAAIEKVGPTSGSIKDDWKVLVGSARDKGDAVWKSTLNDPGVGWDQPDFADASWYISPGGFGGKEGWEKESKTSWTSPDIWLRRKFNAEPRNLRSALLVIHFDNTTEVYVNGHLIWKSAPGTWNDDYQGIDVTGALKKALRGGENTIAVHCHQDTGGQFIDLAVLAR